MIESEKELTNEESLQLINRMIYEGKNYFHESGIGPLILGFGTFACSILAYLSAKNIYTLSFNPFYLLIPVFMVQMFLQLKEEKKKKAKTFTDEAIDYVWAGYFISVVFVIITAIIAGASAYIVVTIALFLTAFACFLTGAISKFRYMIAASFMCWAFAAISFYLLNENSFLLLALAAILAWVIPGFMMNAYLKKQQHAR